MKANKPSFYRCFRESEVRLFENSVTFKKMCSISLEIVGQFLKHSNILNEHFNLAQLVPAQKMYFYFVFVSLFGRSG